MGGWTSPPQASGVGNTELWNGSAWTETTDLNSARYAVGASSTSSTNALVFGGYVTAASAVTEFWNGSSWTEVADMGTSRNYGAGAGPTSTNAIVAGNSANSTATEEWSAADFQIKSVTTS